MDQEYELVVVTSAEKGESDQKNVLDEAKKIIEASKGEVVDIGDWGKKELAYPIKKNAYGLYSLITFKGGNTVPQTINSKFKLMEEILRFLIVRKEGEKIKKVESKRARAKK